MENQNISTKQALDRSDTSNKYTRAADSIANLGYRQSKSADSASDSVTNRAIRENIKNIRTELRAYLFFSYFATRGIKKNSIEWVVVTVNKGKTPAYKSSVFGDYAVGTRELDSVAKNILNQWNPNLVLENIKGTEMGDSTFFRMENPGMAIEKFKGIYAAKDTLFFVNCIKYSDVFRVVHYTRSCHYVIGAGGSKIINTIYRKYNDAN